MILRFPSSLLSYLCGSLEIQSACLIKRGMWGESPTGCLFNPSLMSLSSIRDTAASQRAGGPSARCTRESSGYHKRKQVMCLCAAICPKPSAPFILVYFYIKFVTWIKEDFKTALMSKQKTDLIQNSFKNYIYPRLY